MLTKKRNIPVSKVSYHLYKKNLSRQLGKTCGNVIYESFIKKYGELFFNRTVFTNRALNWHLVKNILPVIALYDALVLCGSSKKEAIDYIGSFNKMMYQKTVIVYRIFGRMPFFFQILRNLAARSMSVTYPKEGWTTTWIENSPKRIAFDVSKCFYQVVLKEYEREELLKCFCQIDDDVYERLSPSVQWKRTTTLGRCGSVCDFRFNKK